MRYSSVYPVIQFNTSEKKVVPAKEPYIDDKTSKSLHKSLKNILLIAQIFGQFPVNGITAETSKFLHFSWKSWKMIYCLVPCVGTAFIMLTLIFKMIKSGTDLFIISTFAFHSCKLGITFSFFHMASCWPNLIKEWTKVEVHMKSYGPLKHFEFRSVLITSTILIVAAIQYIINHVSNIIISLKCKQEYETIGEYFYITLTFPYIFSMMNYSLFTGLLLQLVDLLSSFTWAYVDLFIMVMSSALALRFIQVTERLRVTSESSAVSVNVWKNIREDYNRLCRLCKILDDSMSYIILMSFGSNLFFILIQLFNSLRKMKNILDKLNFFFSFGFLILRTIYVSLYASWINDESKRPISILNSVSSSVYNLEIRRFIQQISFDSVALTGRNFFSVTRGLILSVAGAIVTYELVLIQFNENLLKDNSNNVSCTFTL